MAPNRPKRQLPKIKLQEKTTTGSKATRWRFAIMENDPTKYEEMKRKDAARKKKEYQMLKQRREKGDREARTTLKKKKEKQRETQRRYRERKKLKNTENEIASQAVANEFEAGSFSQDSSSSKNRKASKDTSSSKNQKASRAEYMMKYRTKHSRQMKQYIKEVDRKRNKVV